MYSTKRIALGLVLSFLFITKASSQQDKPLFNAYYLAKELANNNNYKKLNSKTKDSLADDNILKRMLGGVLWYANNDLKRIESIDELLKECEHQDSLLYRKLKLINGTLLNSFNIFDIAEDEIIAVSKEINNMPAIKSLEKIIKLKKDLSDTLSKSDIARLDRNETERNKVLRILKTFKDSLNVLEIKKDSLSGTDTLLNDDIAALKSSIEKNQEALEKSKQIINKESFFIDRISFLKAEIKNLAESLPVDVKIKLKNINPEYMSSSSVELMSSSITQYNNTVVNSREYAEIESNYKPSFAMPSESQMIDALAIYLVKRVKQESVLWFFDAIRKNAKTYELIQKIFPETIELLKGNEIYEVPKMGSLWRYAISKDFVLMPENLLNSEWAKNKVGRGKIDLDDIKTAINMGRMFQQQYTYREIVATLYSNMSYKYFSIDATNKPVNLNTIITLLYCLNEEFIQVSKAGGKHQALQLPDLLHMTNEEFELMLSLIDLKYDHLIQKLLSEQSINIGNNLKLNTLKRWFGNVLIKINQFEKIKNDVNNLKKITEQADDSKFQFFQDNTWKFMSDLLQTFNLQEKDSTILNVFKGWKRSGLQELMKKMADVQEFFYMLEKKNFAGCVNVLFKTVQSMVPPADSIKISRNQLVDKILKLNEKYYNTVLTNYTDLSVQMKFGFSLIKSDGIDSFIVRRNSALYYALNTSDEKAITIIKRLAGFLNDISVTKSSKELAKTIEAYALPPGSYKMKRDSWFSLDLNAYVGLYSGYEWINAPNLGEKTKRAVVYGVTAPVGFSISKTLGKKLPLYIGSDYLSEEYQYESDRIKYTKKNMWVRRSTTLTIFVSAIDIGAVVSYRFGHNDSVLSQKLKWSQVFSPGIHFNVGLKNTPIVFSAGYEYTPSLRNIDSSSLFKTPKSWNVNRIYLGILFDIPLFNFLSSSSKSSIYRKKSFFK